MRRGLPRRRRSTAAFHCVHARPCWRRYAAAATSSPQCSLCGGRARALAHAAAPALLVIVAARIEALEARDAQRDRPRREAAVSAWARTDAASSLRDHARMCARRWSSRESTCSRTRRHHRRRCRRHRDLAAPVVTRRPTSLAAPRTSGPRLRTAAAAAVAAPAPEPPLQPQQHCTSCC